MKKVVTNLMVLFLLLFCIPIGVQAGITSTYEVKGDKGLLTFTCVAASDGSFVATDSSMVVVGYVTRVVTNPGTTAPTDNWDLSIADKDGIDLTGANLLQNRDTATSEEVPVRYTDHALYGGKMIFSEVTATITGNSVNGAEIVIKVYIQR